MVKVERVLLVLQHPHRLLHVRPGQGEADVLALVPADGLDDGVHVDVGPAQQGEDAEGHAGIVRHAHHRDPCDARILRHAGDIGFFHLDNLLDFRAGLAL